MHSRRSRLARLKGEKRDLTDAEIRSKNIETRKKWEKALLKKVIKENEAEWFGTAVQGPQTKRQMKGGFRRKRVNFGGVTAQLKKKTDGVADVSSKTKLFSIEEFMELSPVEVADWAETLHYGALRGHRHKFIRSNISGAILLKLTNRDAALKSIGFGNKSARKMMCKALTRMEKYHQKQLRLIQQAENPHPFPTRPKEEKVQEEFRNCQGLLVRRWKKAVSKIEPEKKKLNTLDDKESIEVHSALLASRESPKRVKLSRKRRRSTSSASSLSKSRSRSRSWSTKRERSVRNKSSRKKSSRRRQTISKSSLKRRRSSSLSSESNNFSC